MEANGYFMIALHISQVQLCRLTSQSGQFERDVAPPTWHISLIVTSTSLYFTSELLGMYSLLQYMVTFHPPPCSRVEDTDDVMPIFRQYSHNMTNDYGQYYSQCGSIKRLLKG